MEGYNRDAMDIEKVLVSAKELKDITAKIAEEIDRDMKDSDKELLLVCVLKGSLIFTSDLARVLKTPLKIDFIKASSYGGGTVSSGSLNISLDCGKHDWENKFVVIVEDIIDSGNTLFKLVEHFKRKGAYAVKTCALLDKPERRTTPIEADYVGRIIPNEFVVGYGLDVDETYRELPFVGILKPEIIEKYIKK